MSFSAFLLYSIFYFSFFFFFFNLKKSSYDTNGWLSQWIVDILCKKTISILCPTSTDWIFRPCRVFFFFSEHLSPAVSSVVGSSEIRQTTRVGQRLFGIKSQYTDHMRRIHNYSPFSVLCSRLWEDWWEDWWVRAISGNGSWLNTPRKCMLSRTRWASVWMDWVNFGGNKVLTDLGIVPWSTTSYHRTLYEFLSLSCAKWFGMSFLIF